MPGGSCNNIKKKRNLSAIEELVGLQAWHLGEMSPPPYPRPLQADVRMESCTY